MTNLSLPPSRSTTRAAAVATLTQIAIILVQLSLAATLCPESIGDFEPDTSRMVAASALEQPMSPGRTTNRREAAPPGDVAARRDTLWRAPLHASPQAPPPPLSPPLLLPRVVAWLVAPLLVAPSCPSAPPPNASSLAEVASWV